jgi:hypothetical protein
MQDLKLEGIGSISGGEYDSVRVEGVGNCSGKIKANNINIEGVFNCSGEIEAGYLYCEGVSDFKSSIRVKKMNIEGVLNQKELSKIEAEEIVCEGVIKTFGEISADRLDAEGCISAREIVGDYIKINSHIRKSRFMKWITRFKSEVNLIEATTIDLSGVTADTVNGKDIIIGPNCRIENIDCSGILSIDSSSTVRNITGEYTRNN